MGRRADLLMTSLKDLLLHGAQNFQPYYAASARGRRGLRICGFALSAGMAVIAVLFVHGAPAPSLASVSDPSGLASGEILGLLEPDVAELYRKGRQAESLEAGIDLLRQAVARSPNHAPALAALAEMEAELAFRDDVPRSDAIERAHACATRAAGLDTGSAAAYAVLGRLNAGFYWDWAAAERAFRRALAINPRSEIALRDYSRLLSGLGRFREALAHASAARDLNPDSMMNELNLARIHYLARQPERATFHSRAALRLDPSSRAPYYWLGRAYLDSLDPASAVNTLERAEPSAQTGLPPAMLAAAYVAAGERDKAVALSDRFEQAARARYVSPLKLAQIALILGDEPARVFELLEEAYQQRVASLTTLKVEPAFDSLRADARYWKLLRKLKLD